MGDGGRDARQPHHRIHPHRPAGGHPRCGAVQRLLGGQPAAQPHRGAGAGGDVHRDLRAGARPRRTRRPRRRHRVRPPPGHPGHRAAAGRDGGVGDRGAAAGPADAGQRPAGQPVPHHRVRLPAAAAGDLLRPVVGVHGNPEHPQRVRAARLGAGGQQPRRDRHPRSVSRCAGRTFGRSRRDGQRQAARARDRHDPWGVRADGRAARRDPQGAGQPATAVGSRRPAAPVRRDGRGDGALRA